MSKARNARLLVVVVALALVITTGVRLLLSDESANIPSLDGEGSFVSILPLRSQAGDPKRTLPQSEGMTKDTAGDPHVASEPNLFYRLSKSRNVLVAAAE
jgi:uncharacterized protein YjiK